MRTHLTLLLNAIRAALPKSHHECELLVLKTTFLILLIIECARKVLEAYNNSFGS